MSGATLKTAKQVKPRGVSLKRRNARSPLQELFIQVRVKSLANGAMRVEPVWRGVMPYTAAEGGGPGVMSRLAGAHRLEMFLNRHLVSKRK